MTFPHLKAKRLVKSGMRLSETSTFRTPKKKWNGFEFREGSSSKHFCSKWNWLSVFQVVPGKRIKLVVSVGWYQIITMEKRVEITICIRIHPIKIGCLPRVISPRKRPPQPTTRLQLELVLFSGSRYKLHKFSTQNSTPKTPPMPTEKLNISKKRLELQATSFLKSCFNGMIPNHCLKNNCCTRHPLKRLLFRVPGCFKCCSFSAAKKVLYVVFFFRHHCRCFCS